jgi:hypothetical protein
MLNGKPDMHGGIDLVPLDGIHPTDLFAVADGIITDARSSVPDTHTGLGVTSMVTGNYVNIRIAGGYTVIYRHLKANSVCVGLNRTVKAGDKIGVMGTTGQSTGIHLHYQINDPNGTAINPEPYLGNDRQIGGIASAPAEMPPLKADDRVKISGGATNYTTGEVIPHWAKERTHTVQQLSKAGDKVLLKEIYSWVWVKDIEKQK